MSDIEKREETLRLWAISHIGDGFDATHEKRVAFRDGFDAGIAAIEAERDALRKSVDQLADTLKNVHEAVCETLGIEGDDALPELVAEWAEGEYAALRKAAFKEAIDAIEKEFLEDPTDSADDIAYDHAVSDCLKAPKQAVPAMTDEQIADAIPVTARVVYGDDRKFVRMSLAELRQFAQAILAAPQPSPEPGIPDGSIGPEGLQHNALLRRFEHEHDWRFSLQDHVYKCDCGSTRGDYPFGAASFKD